MITLQQLVADATLTLQAAGVPSPAVDAEMLLAHVLGVPRGEMLSRLVVGTEISPEHHKSFEVLLERRAAREPLQHLVGLAPFMNFELSVGPGVFVPRPETESLAERAIHHASTIAVGDGGVVVVDLCAGSGALAIALARALPYAKVCAVEISPEATPYLLKNTQALAPEVEVYHQSVLEFAQQASPASVDMIVANPPYVPEAQVPNDPEVALFDPHLALYGGVDGLDVVRQIVEVGMRVLRPGGVLMMEHSNLHGEPVRGLLVDAGYTRVDTERDLTGRERFSTGFRP
jgi:release factor glutamine methyltransferase